MATCVTLTFKQERKNWVKLTWGQKLSKSYQEHWWVRSTTCTLTTFSSVWLMEDLLEDELYACGTFHNDRRGLSLAIVQTTLGKWITNIYTDTG